MLVIERQKKTMHRKYSLTIFLVGGLVCLTGLSLLFLSTANVVESQDQPIAEFVGADSCTECHAAEAAQHELHGHNWKLNAVVDGTPPDYPFTEVPSPPEGYTWDDVSFVIGGSAWKARFIDHDGFIITGDEDATTQYNFPLIDERTGDVIVEENWVAYNPGTEKPYTCGECHTTGYNHDTDTNMYDMPGLVGQWAEEGIQCEECHGAGSLHVEEPIRVDMRVDRDSEACGQCHYRGAEGVIESKGGFVSHHEQYEEIITAPHAAMDCVTCHNPHQSAVHAEAEINPNQGLRNSCENCHFDQASWAEHDEANVQCTDCHMPPMTASGARNADLLWADVSTHLYQINVDADAPQFSEDGTSVMPYITVEYACTRCHIEDFDLETMQEESVGYHDN